MTSIFTRVGVYNTTSSLCFDVWVLAEAPVIIKEPNRTLVEEHGDTELSCEVSGNPIPTISWTLNGELQENDPYITISSK